MLQAGPSVLTTHNQEPIYETQTLRQGTDRSTKQGESASQVAYSSDNTTELSGP